MAAPSWPTMAGALPPSESNSSAKGMKARPPNCIRLPNQRYGIRRRPKAERW